MDLYYYTTAETMKYILSGGNIFATNMKYMNDSEEYLNGLKEVRDYLLNVADKQDLVQAAKRKLSKAVYEKRREGEINSFSISFTTARDLLSQWSMYAKESGVSLKMEFEERDYEFLTYNPSDKDRDTRPNYCMHPQEVYYFTKGVLDDKQYEETGCQIIQKMKKQFERQGMEDYDDNIEKLWLWITPFVKRADFGAEEEYRLVFDFNNVMCYTPRVDFRIDKNVIKPYLDIGLKEGWPITEITVGPGFNQEAVFNGISYYLSKGKVLVPPITMEKMGKKIEEYFQNMEHAGINTRSVNALLKQWIEKYTVFTNDVKPDDNEAANKLYLEFRNFLSTKNDDKRYKEYIRNNYFAMSGIVLKKSKIPYIY